MKRIRGILLFVCALLLSGCLGPDCSNEIREEMPSPIGQKRIVIFMRDCGATTGFNCQASILNSGEKLPNDGGNLLIIDNGIAKISWQSENRILVVLSAGSRIFKKEALVRGIAVDYREE